MGVGKWNRYGKHWRNGVNMTEMHFMTSSKHCFNKKGREEAGSAFCKTWLLIPPLCNAIYPIDSLVA